MKIIEIFTKIIDDQGRLFGKVNIIDLIVLIFFLSLTPMFYFGWKIYQKPPPTPPQKCMLLSEYEKLVCMPKINYENNNKEYQRLKKIEAQLKVFLKEYKSWRKHFK